MKKSTTKVTTKKVKEAVKPVATTKKSSEKKVFNAGNFEKTKKKVFGL